MSASVWIEWALALGRRGRGMVHPNPEVGCVIVQGDRVVGEGFHAAYGGPHAEAAALEAAGDEARGATAYVTLEPCAHEGKTPPCVHALIDAGVSKVVYGCADPTKAGGGAEVMQEAGIEVVGPVLSEDRARLENPAFFYWADTGMPWIQIKLAMSLDGKIAAMPGARTAISGPEAADWVHTLRGSADAILVGSTTAVVDDPNLTVRSGVQTIRPPLRVVLDSNGRMEADAAMLQDEAGAVHIFVSTTAPPERAAALRDAGATVHVTDPGDDAAGLPLQSVMSTLGGLGVRSVLCEGGGVLASALVREDLAQRIHLIVAPVSLGSQGVPAFTDDLIIDPAAWRTFDALPASDDEASRALGRDAVASFRQAY